MGSQNTLLMMAYLTSFGWAGAESLLDNWDLLREFQPKGGAGDAVALHFHFDLS